MQQIATLQKTFNLNYQTNNVRIFPRGAFAVCEKKHYNTCFKKMGA